MKKSILILSGISLVVIIAVALAILYFGRETPLQEITKQYTICQSEKCFNTDEWGIDPTFNGRGGNQICLITKELASLCGSFVIITNGK